ncbi:CoA transferase [Ramlibacter sp. AN1015]|uniref:CoA transferase n=1 Tax=Ramlibacter sp. AN1015 TaxID=3133428 RepID=UPI0030C41A28
MQPPSPQPLAGVRILSLALNLPGPAALMRCRRMGAECIKIEPPAGDPMRRYEPTAYDALHEGVFVITTDLKDPVGQAVLHAEIARATVLLTSFRPSALARLGLAWPDLTARYPRLSQVAIVGGAGASAEAPGHDLTYQAEHGLVTGTELPTTLHADMAGALMAAEAVLQAALLRERGRYLEVPLAEAAAFLALPRHWGLTLPDGAVGGANPGYRVYACRDGRIAVAALEPHFARALAAAVGLGQLAVEPLAAYFAARTRAELDALARQHDLPLHTMA